MDGRTPETMNGDRDLYPPDLEQLLVLSLVLGEEVTAPGADLTGPKLVDEHHRDASRDECLANGLVRARTASTGRLGET